MGSNQSSITDRNNTRTRHGRLSSSQQRERNKNKKTLPPNVNSGRTYEHLACTNDNSARSSPSDIRSSLSTLKDVDKKKSPSIVCFPCFGCVGNDEELTSRGVPNPGQNNDSVALLRVSSKLSLRAVELDDENNFSPEKSEPCTDETPSDENLEDVVQQISWTRNQRAEHVSDVDCVYRKVAAKEVVASEAVMKGSVVSCEKHVQPDESVFDRDQTGSGRLFVVSKRHLSFPCGLFSYAQSKPVVEGYGNRQLAVMPTRGRIDRRASERAKEVDCMSNSPSYEDSGKASESESALLSLEQGSNVCKAPIAKIDSLETTSMDSLNSDDLMVDTMGFSCTSFKELEESGSRDPCYIESMNAICRHQQHNHSVNARHGLAKGEKPDRVRPSCSSVSEPKLDRRHPDAFDRHGTQNAVDEVLAGTDGNVTLRETADRIRRVKWTIPEIPGGAKERKRLSYPYTGAELPFLGFDNLRPTSLDLTDANRLSSTIHEMPDLSMPSGDEFMVLDRETQDDLRNDIESCRALLLDLGVLICQDEINSSTHLDSRNNNSSHFSMDELGKKSLQVTELRQDSTSYEELAMENNELRTQLTSLQTLMIEQQKLINTLEKKLTHLSITSEKTNHNAVFDVHSTPMATSG